MEEINGLMPEGNVEYTEDNIRHLDDMEHIRVRSGMYIGRLGDGTQNDDGIYVLLKEVICRRRLPADIGRRRNNRLTKLLTKPF